MKESFNTDVSEKNNKKYFDDRQWKEITKIANQSFAEDNFVLAHQQYLETRNLAEKLFIDCKELHPVPDALTSMLVISYLNLAECSVKQNNKKEQASYLFEIYEFLKFMLSESKISDALSQQIYQGISKVYPDLYLCLKRLDKQEKLIQLENDFSAITTFYQAQTWAIN